MGEDLYFDYRAAVVTKLMNLRQLKAWAQGVVMTVLDLAHVSDKLEP